MIVSVKNFQRFTNVFSEDEGLQESYLQSAQNVVEDYLGYGLRRQIHTVFLDGNGSFELQLRARPVNEILSVQINGVEMDSRLFYSQNEFIYLKEGVFPVGRRNVIVKYDAGYSEAQSSESAGGCCCVLDDDGNQIVNGGWAEITPELEPAPEPTDPPENPDSEVMSNAPAIIQTTILRIAAILQTESDGNIGITSKSFGDSGNRTFVNQTNFDKYLIQISGYKIIRI